MGQVSGVEFRRVESGENPDEARAKAARTIAFYTGS
jgi:hypothetical protein